MEIEFLSAALVLVWCAEAVFISIAQTANARSSFEVKASADNLFLEKFIYYTDLGLNIDDTLMRINQDDYKFSVVRHDENGKKQTVSLEDFPSYYIGDVRQYLN